MLVAILVSTVMLGLDNPLNDPNSMLARVLAVLDLVIVGIFLFEFAIKVVAMGFIVADGAYIRDIWNQLDFFLVLVGPPPLVTSAG